MKQSYLSYLTFSPLTYGPKHPKSRTDKGSSQNNEINNNWTFYIETFEEYVDYNRLLIFAGAWNGGLDTPMDFYNYMDTEKVCP